MDDQAEMPLDRLTDNSFPQLASAIRSQAQEILLEWAKIVRQMLPTADKLTFDQLRDSFPNVVQEIADAVAMKGSGPVDIIMANSAEHGETRFHQSYNLNEVLIEYHLFRRVLIESASRGLGRALNSEEAMALHLSIDTAMRRAVIAFSEHQTQQLHAATEAQRKYLSFLSHDLRGGLNGIFLMIEVLRRELAAHPQFTETLEDLNLMRRSLLETVATMDRFLHAERFSKGKVKVKPAPVVLDQLLNEVAAHFAYQAKDKSLEIRVEAPGPIRFTSDRELLTMIFQNLVSNAVKYTSQGTVRISAHPADGEWQVEITDEGPGISPEKLAHLFDSFTRGDTHGEPGVGLGLNIAHQAAKLLGAKLWVESSQGKGSTFHVLVPELKTSETDAG